MRIKIFLIICLLSNCIFSFSQQNTIKNSIVFYNVENLFDTYDDTLSIDEEFTPRGDRHWTSKKLNRKLTNISKVILSCSGWSHPALVALCEVENRRVLEMLTNNTPLKTVGYKIIHKESPDHRGIDVALLYDEQQFYPLTYNHYPLLDKKGETQRTREIMYVSGILNQEDTIHLFINHWPSRYSGVLETHENRNKAAQLLRNKIEDLFERDKSAKIIVMGDFNDQPNDESLSKYLKAREVEPHAIDTILYNLSYHWGEEQLGTLKYQSQWSVFDQIIVSGSLLNDDKGICTNTENAIIINFPFLTERDQKYGGIKPKRTYYGFTYQGGFSDHLPVLLRLKK